MKRMRERKEKARRTHLDAAGVVSLELLHLGQEGTLLCSGEIDQWSTGRVPMMIPNWPLLGRMKLCPPTIVFLARSRPVREQVSLGVEQQQTTRRKSIDQLSNRSEGNRGRPSRQSLDTYLVVVNQEIHQLLFLWCGDRCRYTTME